MANRVELLRVYIDKILLNMNDTEERRCAYLHLYGVSQTCAMLALKRGLNPDLATTMGMLHDLHSYKTMNPLNHAMHGAILAKEILSEFDDYSEEEIEVIATAISNHSSKGTVESAYDELLKDADVLQHYLYNVGFEVREKEKKRLALILAELGIN